MVSDLQDYLEFGACRTRSLDPGATRLAPCNGLLPFPRNEIVDRMFTRSDWISACTGASLEKAKK